MIILIMIWFDYDSCLYLMIWFDSGPKIKSNQIIWHTGPPHTKNFFQRGGTVDSALRVIFDFAYDQDEWTGDGDHRDVFDEKINALPECRNDQEFGLVSLACGIQYSRSLYG